MLWNKGGVFLYAGHIRQIFPLRLQCSQEQMQHQEGLILGRYGIFDRLGEIFAANLVTKEDILWGP